MRVFSGSDARVYSLGDEYRFQNIPLEDCGDGWDWRAPTGLMFWLEDPLVETWGGGRWEQAGAVDVFRRSGRVALSRCVSGPVRASGVCLPTSLVATADTWRLSVEVFVSQSTVLGEGEQSFSAKRGRSAVLLSGVEDHPIGVVLVHLHQADGCFAAVGEAKSLGNVVQVDVDEEGVRYVPR